MVVPAPAFGQIQGSGRSQPAVFADQRTKKVWELLQEVQRICKDLPPEDSSSTARTVSFDPENAALGTYALLFAGTMVGTDRHATFLVPDRSTIVLDRLRIPYHLV